MSFPVNGSNAHKPSALWQSLLQPDSTAGGSAQSDPMASLLATLGQGTTASTGGAASTSTSGAPAAGGSAPQFGAQTLQTLFDMQANAAPSQGSNSSASANASAGGANVANNNLLERLIQMQAQLINPATAQNVATA
jgi:hypothetical protein